MEIIDIIWLPEVLDKIDWKHNVHAEEVEDVLFGKTEFRKVQKGHVSGEDLYAAMGRTYSGRYLIIFFIYKSTRKAIIISARDMDKKERRLYEKK